MPSSMRAHTQPTPNAQYMDVSMSGRKGSLAPSRAGCTRLQYTSKAKNPAKYRTARGGIILPPTGLKALRANPSHPFPSSSPGMHLVRPDDPASPRNPAPPSPLTLPCISPDSLRTPCFRCLRSRSEASTLCNLLLPALA
eukprot:1151551-Pelagomonas_calceolata.AAC.7